MAIYLTNPITIPVVQQRVADKVWISSMTVNAKYPDEPITATFVVTPYSTETNETFKELSQTFTVDDVFLACQTNQVLAQALGAIYAAVDNLIKERGLFGLEPDQPVYVFPPDPEPTPDPIVPDDTGSLDPNPPSEGGV